MATDYGKWDKVVAGLSSSEDEGDDLEQKPAEQPAGWGKPLTEQGQIDRTGELTVGNAKGNALSTNADAAKVFDIHEKDWSWRESADAVEVDVVLPASNQSEVDKDLRTHDVQVSFLAHRVTISLDRNAAGERHVLIIDKLPGIDEKSSSFSVSAASTSGAESKQPASASCCRVTLQKVKPGLWGHCGVQKSAVEVKGEIVTVSDYSWADDESTVSVYIKMPGVHLCDSSKHLEVRFRELSFDVTFKNPSDGKIYMFAVTELPMEIMGDKCKFRVKPDEVRVTLRKWARCSWFKLQVHRE